MSRPVVERTVLAVALLAVAALVAVACGSSDDGDIGDPTNTIAGPQQASATTAETDAPDSTETQIDLSSLGPAPRFGEVNLDQLRRMITVDEDGPFYMVNLIRFRERASYPDGRDADLTGREANDRYAVLPILLEIGAQPVFVAEVERQLLGDDIEWDQVAIVLYPSRAAFLEMLQRPDYQALAVHKDAGVERSIVLVTEPIELQGVPDVDLATVPFGPSEEDQPFSMMHLMAFNTRAQYEDGRTTDITGRDALALYEQNVAPLAIPRGVRPVLRLAVEGALVGDGREWDEVRINNFPSHATFFDMISDPTYAPGLVHREAALASTYALITLPIIDQVSQR